MEPFWCAQEIQALKKKTESNINYLEIYSIVWAYIFG